MALIVRRPVAACFAVAGSMMVGGGVVIVIPGGAMMGSPAAAATNADYAPDVDGLLDRRSPGERRYGWLVDAKQSRYTADNPVERVLSSVRQRPVVAAETGDVVPLDAPITTLAGIPDPGGVIGDVIAPGAIGGGISGSAPIAGGVLPGTGGGGTGGGGGSGDTPDTSTPPNPVSPVPEPASWAMLLIGFALLGLAVRRRGSTLAFSQ